jgi:tetratricopeptide (TPR) repeat protein
MARTISDRRLEALSLSTLGAIILLQGNVDEGVPLLEQSLAISRALGDKIGQADTIQKISLNNSNLQLATSYSRECIELRRELGDLSGIAVSLTTLSRLTFFGGDFSSPIAWLEETLSISRQIGSRSIEGYALNVYGDIAYWQGNYKQAISYYEQQCIIAENLGDRFLNLWAYVHMAYPFLRMGDIKQARHTFEKVVRDAQKADWIIVLIFAVEGLASLHVNQKQPERAARLFAWADRMRKKTGDRRPPVEQASVEKDLAVIHSKIDDAEFTRLSAEGRIMTIEQAIVIALEEINV